MVLQSRYIQRPGTPQQKINKIMKTWLIIRAFWRKQIPSYITTIWGITPKKGGGVGAINGADGWWCTTLLFLDLLVKNAWKQETHAQMVVKQGDFTRIESVKHHQLNKEKKLVSLWEGQQKPWEIHGWNFKKLTKLRRKIIFSIHLVSLDWKSTDLSVYLVDPFPFPTNATEAARTSWCFLRQPRDDWRSNEARWREPQKLATYPFVFWFDEDVYLEDGGPYLGYMVSEWGPHFRHL